jgi:putative flippase GtrA
MSHVRAVPRYLVVGGALALLSNAILIVFDHFGIGYVVSCVVAFAITLILAYGLHTHWTFGTERSLRGLLRYGAAMALNLPVSVALLFFLVSLGRLSMTVAAPAATITLTVFNYLIAATLLRSRSHRALLKDWP